jgi:hypothetical protein
MSRDEHSAESPARCGAVHRGGTACGQAIAPRRIDAAHRAADRRGQATVELVGLLPLLVTVVFAAAQLLAAGVAHELADHAAQAGAMAVLQDTDAPADAARDALPGWARDRAKIDVDGDHVSVTLAPPAPLSAVAEALTAHAEADAS